MSRITPMQRNPYAGASAWRKKAALALVATVAGLIFPYILLASVFTPSVKVDPGSGSREVPLDSRLTISTSWMRGSIKSVTVKETRLDPLGNPGEERLVEGRLDDGIFMPRDGSPLLRSDSRYDVTVEAQLTEFTAIGPKRRDVTESFSFQTIVTPAPIFLKEKQVVPLGEPIVVEFNTPIEGFDYEIEPEITTSMAIDEENPTRAFISFDKYEQGKSFKLTITDAQAQNGAKMEHAYSQTVTTTEPLRVVFVPGDTESGVSMSKAPSLTFSEKIQNKEAFESLVSIEPSAVGAWEWLNDETVEFQPLNKWTEGAKITIRLKGGPDALRSSSGGFLRENVESSFTIKPSKMIDVNLTEQKVYLYDHDQLVKTMICSSGSKATPSLTGTYAVYHKAEKVTMRGEGYEAPDVPWVLMFNGDYTIHGNYWATQFGVPSSHGCVGLPLPEAEYLYNWTPIGTIVKIHY